MDNIHTFEHPGTIEQEAREWLIRLDGDAPLSAQEVAALHAWSERSPAHREELLRITAFWNEANIMTELAIPLYSNAKKGWGRLGAWQLAGWFAQRLTPAFNLSRGALASVLFALLFATTLVYTNGWYPRAIDASNGIYATAIGELREEKLAEGSVMQINTDSQVQVDFSDPVRKIRLLRGEAHFKVAHDQQRPFEVYAGKGRVQAVGTAFSVRLNQDNRLDVIVTDGKVALAAAFIDDIEETRELNGQPPAATNGQSATTKPITRLKTLGTLQQGEGLNFSTDFNATDGESVKLAQQDIQRNLAWREGYLVFAGEPLSLVVKELNRYMPITVEINDPELSELPIGGRFKVVELEALLDVLETNFGILVSRLDDQRVQLSLGT